MLTRPDDDADVLIAGGGVAGATLAILLGRAGVTVRLFERRTLPHEKACAEGIMPAGVGVLCRMGLGDVVGGRPFTGVRYVGWGSSIESPFPRASGVPATGRGQRRLHLDRALLNVARATPGVHVNEGTAVEAPVLQSGRVRGLEAGGRMWRARLLVAADGPLSPLRRAVGLERRARGPARVGVRAHFRLAAGMARPEQVEVFLADGHELYMTPLPGDEVVVAALAPVGAEKAGLDARFAAWRAQHPWLMQRLEGAEPISALAGRSPLRTGAHAGQRPGLVLLGDAAGAMDPVTGGGMAQALQAAEALALRLTAGRLLRAAFDAGDDRLAAFDRDRRLMLRDGRLLTAFLLRLLHRPPLARAMVRLLDRSPPLFAHLLGVAANGQALLPL